MDTDRDTTRIVRSWLEDGATALPDRILDAVLDQVPATRQHRPLWPVRRIDDMNMFAKLLVAAAAVVAVAFVGTNLLPTGGGLGGAVVSPSPSATSIPSPSPTPRPTPTASPTPTSPPADLVPYNDEPMAPGSYSVYGTHGDQQLRVTFDVPAGWFGHENWWVHNGGSGSATQPDPADPRLSSLVVYGLDNPVNVVFPDPCLRQRLVAVGPTVDDLVTGLSNEEHRAVTDGPTDVTVSGYSGKSLMIGPAGSLDVTTCPADHLEPWRAQDGERWIQPELVQTIRIIDVDGQPLLIEGNYGPDTPASDRAAMLAMMDSIRIAVD